MQYLETLISTAGILFGLIGLAYLFWLFWTATKDDDLTPETQDDFHGAMQRRIARDKEMGR